MTGQGNETAADAAGHGQLRASHADRDEVVDQLKAAFVAGQLTRDELDARVGQALASKTFAQLAPLTADIAAAPIAAAPLPKRPRAQTRPLGSRVLRSGATAVIAACVAAVAVLATAIAHVRPSPDVVACQTFYMWAQPMSGGPDTGMLLDFSLASANQGSDPTLTADLQALQQAVQRYESPTGPLPSAAAQQVSQNRVDAAIARVNAACLPYSN
jgi:hypothetical protein